MRAFKRYLISHIHFMITFLYLTLQIQNTLLITKKKKITKYFLLSKNQKLTFSFTNLKQIQNYLELG